MAAYVAEFASLKGSLGVSEGGFLFLRTKRRAKHRVRRNTGRVSGCLMLKLIRSIHIG
jgi:hypothetical protein